MSNTKVKTKVGEVEFTQQIIDAYEQFIWNVKEALRFVKMGTGGNETTEILETIIDTHEKEMWEQISNTFDNDKNEQTN